MAGNSPKLWAAADLHPVSPAPLHPPSPIIVPALQDQADAYSSMSLSIQNPLKSATPAELLKLNQIPAPAVPVQDGTPNSSPDQRRLDLESINLERAVNGMSEKEADMLSASITQTDAQKTKTSQSHVTGAEQDIGSISGSTFEPDGCTLAAPRFDALTSARESNSFISQAFPVPGLAQSSKHTTLQLDRLPGNLVADTTVSHATNAPIHQSPSNHSQVTHEPHAIDIQALLDSINTQAANGDVGMSHNPTFGGSSNGKVLPQSTIVLPEPPTTEQASTQSYHPAGDFPFELSQINSTHLSPNNKLVPSDYTFATTGKLGPNASAKAISAASPIPNHVLRSNRIDEELLVENHRKQTWDDFDKHEPQHAERANRNGFPEGSRIFLGNLSERVSRREIFDVFSKHGHVLQISIKPAYGFVQYGTVAEANAAMDNLQGIELGNRKLNLEPARKPTRDGEKSRRNQGRQDGSRHDSKRGRRDDHWSGSYHRPDHRQQPLYDVNDRDWAHEERSYSRSRHRSQSPRHNDYEPYRRRSRSPHRRHTSTRDVDSTRRHGTEAPDVQFFVSDVSRDFVIWVQHEFVRMNLRVDALPVRRHQSIDEAVQRLIFDGVHATVMLDLPAQDRGVISLRLYGRSGSFESVRYEDYHNLQPAVAAQLVASRQPSMPSSFHTSRHSLAQYPLSAYVPPSSRGHQNYPPPVAPDAVLSLQDPLAVQSMLTAMGSPTQGLGALPNMNYLNPAPAAPHTRNSAEQIHDILRQLNGPS
ncbi:hypothetical protein F5Y09DRAFT_143273 [Xylaria sp. FL1042]|nr:hypothetical protein F5Y09DRAFT_143273 [Xylaria sp. FL1042]